MVKTGVPCENHRPAVCHWQTVPHNVVSKQQLNNQSIKLIQTENLPPRWAPKTIVTNTKTAHLIIVSMLSCTCDISLRLQVDIYIYKLILESHVIVYVFWLVLKSWGYFEWTEQIISINPYELIQIFFVMILKNRLIFFKIRQIIGNKFK